MKLVAERCQYVARAQSSFTTVHVSRAHLPLANLCRIIRFDQWLCLKSSALYSAESLRCLPAYEADDILTDRRVSTVTGDNRWSPALSIPNYLSQSTFLAARPTSQTTSQALATISRRLRTCAAPPSPQKAARWPRNTWRAAGGRQTGAIQSGRWQKSFVLDGDSDESMSSQLTAARRGRRPHAGPRPSR